MAKAKTESIWKKRPKLNRLQDCYSRLFDKTYLRDFWFSLVFEEIDLVKLQKD